MIIICILLIIIILQIFNSILIYKLKYIIQQKLQEYIIQQKLQEYIIQQKLQENIINKETNNITEEVNNSDNKSESISLNKKHKKRFNLFKKKHKKHVGEQDVFMLDLLKN